MHWFLMLAQQPSPTPSVPDWDWWESRGLAAVMLAAVCYAIWRIGNALWVRLFDDKTGYVTRALDRHLTFMDKATSAAEKNAESTERLTEAMETAATAEIECRERHSRTMLALHSIAEGHKTETQDIRARDHYAAAQTHLAKV